LKSTARKALRKAEHFSINAIDGVVLECLTAKNSAKKAEYLMKMR
jgi:hypothetical protein